MQLTARLRNRASRALSADAGFTMIVTLGVLLVSSLLMAAVFVAAEGDIHLTKRDTSAKKAYYAAQAGIDDYAFHLNRDVNYWTYCTEGEAATNKALNQVGSTANKVKVPGATEEEYAIQLLPASTSPENKCNRANPTATMIEGGSEAGGTFRIESTGYSGNEQRSIVATFANAGFLNFIYYTKYETLDPNTYTPAKPQCAAFRASRPSGCENIRFVEGDDIEGPLHTEDTAEICGHPTFGRTSQDLIEFKGGWVGAGCGGDSPNMKGTEVPKGLVEQMEPPPSNTSLKSIAGATYSGKTTIVLTGETMTVTNNSVTHTGVPFPSNGVIYVSNVSCAVTSYTPYNPSYTADSGCGNVYVSGNYTKSLTIAAENDVVIDGNLTTPTNAEGTPTTGAVLGLIANNFVRVYHPLTGSRSSSYGSCGSSKNNTSEDLTNAVIYAAILAVNHSFIIDNFDCGEPLGKLTVYGAIAQIFRGTVGTGNGTTVVSGYLKNYKYDDRLQVESPPSFLNPVKASWRVRRETLTSP
jgi:type II secretory pathway pseudopilin PulG